MNEKQFTNFMKDIDMQDHVGCWMWPASKDSNGYGVLRVGGRLMKAHRVSWELTFGRIPLDKLVLHRCNNKGCVNPSHLYLGYQTDNMADALKIGYRLPNPPKLYDEEIWLVRRLLACGVVQAIIARMFRVSQGTISNIKRRSNLPSKGSINKGGVQ